ncbi:MAG: hypothetical protein E7328_06385 [Clostridiales bacterium]|nr:hypothetical protein [Clostridiales bacterium]
MEDIIIRGGCIYDGTGSEGYLGDIAIKDGIITAMGKLSHLSAKEELCAHGLAVAPGFIDSHAHSDVGFLSDDSYASKLYQGITTEISGQCGGSPFPAADADSINPWSSFDAFTHAFSAGGYAMGTNQAMLVGHGTLRTAVLGYEDRPATRHELNQMKSLLRRDLQSGAFGMSLGLEYSPGFFAPMEELCELSKVVKEFDGLIPCHMRNEGEAIFSAMDELITIGKVSGARVHISHIKLDRHTVHGNANKVWQHILDARKNGVQISADVYPFTASCTTLSIRCPNWSLEGGEEGLMSHLRGERRNEVIEGIRSHYFNAERAETCLISDDKGYWPEIVGKTLRFVAEEMLFTTDYAAAAAEILLRTHGKAYCIFFVMDEKDMLYFLQQDIGIGSDGYALTGDRQKLGSNPHPRSYGTMPEFFRLRREHNFCTLSEAIRRVTQKPAQMIGLKDRGILKPGMVADVTVFDPDTIAPRSTYLAPVALSTGVEHVIIGGGIALKNGKQTELRLGKFLKKTGARHG